MGHVNFPYNRMGMLWWENNTAITAISDVGEYELIARDITNVITPNFTRVFGSPIAEYEAGFYTFEWLTEIECAIPNQSIGVALYIGGIKRSINGRTKILPFSEVESVHAFMLIELLEGDEPELRVANFTGTNNLTIVHNRVLIQSVEA